MNMNANTRVEVAKKQTQTKEISDNGEKRELNSIKQCAQMEEGNNNNNKNYHRRRKKLRRKQQ